MLDAAPGRIAENSRGADAGFIPLNATFLEWYERWIGGVRPPAAAPGGSASPSSPPAEHQPIRKTHVHTFGRSLTAAALLAAVLGCGGGEPRVRTRGSVAGEYVLVERDGKPLPHPLRVLDGTGRPCTTVLVRLVLALHDDGSWVQEGEGRSHCPGEPSPRRDPIEDAGAYDLLGPAGDSVVLRDTLRPNPEEKGVFVRDELRTVMPQPPPHDTLRFRYVRQPRRE